MKLLEDRIRKDGIVIGDDILKVDMFLNHQIDPILVDEMAAEFHRHFGDKNITKILTVESSGIAIAIMTAKYFGKPLLFAKKASHKNVGSDLYSVTCYSYTHGENYTMNISKKYLSSDDNVLIIDDFLADGNASNGLMELCRQAGASVAGIGIAVEKGFQSGGNKLREAGYDLLSLAIVDSMANGEFTFRSDRKE